MSGGGGSSTSKDVAALAGVSQSTVSYVMSGKRSVSEKTRMRVNNAIRELSYHPHAGARSLRGRKTQVLALDVRLGHTVDAVGAMPYVDTIIEEARRRDYDVVLLTTDEGSEGLERVARRSICDAFMLMDIRAKDERLQAVSQLGLPAILVGRPDDAFGLDAIDFDAYAAGSLLAEHLVELGHRHLVVMGDPPDVLAAHFRFIEEFERGVREAANAARVEHRVVPMPEDGWNGVLGAAEELLVARKNRLGLITRTPQAADWILQLLRLEQLQPGRDVSVVGLLPDDVAAKSVPPLTNVSPEPRTHSRIAIEMLFRRMEGATDAPTLRLVAPRPLTRRNTSVSFC